MRLTPETLRASVHTARARRAYPTPETNAFRAFHGEADGITALFIDVLDDILFVTTSFAVDSAWWPILVDAFNPRAIYHKFRPDESHPRQGANVATRVWGETVSKSLIQENSVAFVVKPDERFSYGLFLDQRENRKELRARARAGMKIINLFSYTGGFSVIAALKGAETVSVDLSRGHLEWARENFAANNLPLAGHDFIYGDARAWLKKFIKRHRTFDVAVIDPPTFSTSDEGVFQLERELDQLVEGAVGCLVEEGTLFISHNCQTLSADASVKKIHTGLERAGRRALSIEPGVLPSDFPSNPKPSCLSWWVTTS
jgi:23S rRNA (cytosine1962-C5)-methyltransferase